MSVGTDAGVRSAIALLSTWIESQMAYSGLPGLSVGVVHDQELVWAAGFCRAGLEPARPATSETLYRVASITKLLTATACSYALPASCAWTIRSSSTCPSSASAAPVPTGRRSPFAICSRTRLACRARPALPTGPTANSRRRSKSERDWPTSTRRCRPSPSGSTPTSGWSWPARSSPPRPVWPIPSTSPGISWNRSACGGRG